MTEELSKQDIFKHELEAIEQSRQSKYHSIDDLLTRIFSCAHCILHNISLDALEPLPADLPEAQEHPGTRAVAGRLMFTWYLYKNESQDGAEYEFRCIEPYKCWLGSDGALRLRQQKPLSKEAAEQMRITQPVFMRDKQVYFALPSGNPDDDKIDELDFRMFEKMVAPADKGFERLKLVLTLLSDGTDTAAAAAEQLLDEKFCPDLKKRFDDLAAVQSELTLFTDKLCKEYAQKLLKEKAEALAQEQAQPAAQAENQTQADPKSTEKNEE